MHAYTASGWRPPTRPVTTPILKSTRKQLSSKSTTHPQPAKSVTLQTINEEQPLPSTNTRVEEGLNREILALQRQCALLQSQRDEAFAELDKVLSAAPRKEAENHLSIIRDLETQRNDALEALDEVLSAPQTKSAAHLARISELETQKRILEERCKTFSAWAEQQRVACSKHAAESQRHKQTCDQLNESLTEFYAKHAKLCTQHQELETKMKELQASMALPTPTPTQAQTPTPTPTPGPDLAEQVLAARAEAASEVRAARERAAEAGHRAVAAEKTTQALLGVRTLIQSAPVALELSLKTRGILESTIDVLNLANQPTVPESIQACLTQVCRALANLGDEAAEHAAAAKGWLAKRDSVLRSGLSTERERSTPSTGTA